jgi:hypothetical protein|tara:strand:- start:13 stop:333 length:321 start_codon:yes stop_codon:yes gene_type:complete
MKLYVNEGRTRWAGTQADAKKNLGKFEAWNVPTDKTGLLEFLNNFDITPSVNDDYVAEQSSEAYSMLDRHAGYVQDYFSDEMRLNRNDRHLTEGESGWDRPDKKDL